MARLFTLFERFEIDESIPGKGIGLATCRKIAERLGGRMWAESAIGAGSKFYFSVPLHVPESSEVGDDVNSSAQLS